MPGSLSRCLRGASLLSGVEGLKRSFRASLLAGGVGDVRGFGQLRGSGFTCSLEGAGCCALRSSLRVRSFNSGESLTSSGVRGVMNRRSRFGAPVAGVSVRLRVTTGRLITSPGGRATRRELLRPPASIVGAEVAGVGAISGKPGRTPRRIQSDTSVVGADGRECARSVLLKPSTGTTVTPRAGGLIPIRPSPGRCQPLRLVGSWGRERSPACQDDT